MIHAFQLKWKTYLLLYYAIGSAQWVQISGEGSALSFLPYSKLDFHILFFFFLWRMWHICISLFVLIRICWLKVNEIESSWWHWIHLLLCLNTLHTANSLITCLSHTFISTNAGTPFSFRWLTVIRCPPPTRTHCHWSNSAQECSLNYPSNTSLLFYFQWGAFLQVVPAHECLECTPLSSLLL